MQTILIDTSTIEMTCAVSQQLPEAQLDQYCVGIVDDEPGVRTMLSHVLRANGLAVRAYESAESLLADDERVQFGCLILDIGLSGISGLDLQCKLRRCSCSVPVIIVSGRATVSDTIQAYREHASAVFEKPFELDELVSTVRQLMSKWIEKQRREQQIAEKMGLLTAREREVMDLLVLGRKTTQIANAMSISASTVEKHRLHIFEKTGVDSVVDLINWLR